MKEPLWNLASRTVTCLTCVLDSESAQPAPKCPACGDNLITVVYSALRPGQRVTPLAR